MSDRSGVPPSLPLAPDEDVVWSDRPRLSAAAPAVVAGVLVAVVSVGAALAPAVRLRLPTWLPPLVALAGVFVGALVAGWPLLSLLNTRYVLTDRAAYVKRGVVGRSVSRARLSMVQDSAYAQSLSGSVFGYGTVELRTAGGQFDFRRVDDPAGVRTLVDRQRGSGDADRLPGTPDQWRAVLAEARALRRTVEPDR
ncbi:PH domain-containing protein [Candidatus Halobonum tyrrellensis]|uniref:YdbS-like PH domain-containing protein n=1 Tax=Candidatus Halobonum tyrrellensis G22 TaxID=1324957 RepID=V4HEP2_9EURY|nr:PH domain-containing protein [Candidatus Halobonum tyrrellensis]ESP88563.1 hypothetical protein K933_08887 [Candidatus Halobonum tyrrellensis G22]